VLFKKWKIIGQKRSGLGHVTYFQILGSLYVSRTVNDKNLKCGLQINYDEYYSNNLKLEGKARNLLFNSVIPQYFRYGKSYRFPKVVNGDYENLGAEPSSWYSG